MGDAGFFLTALFRATALAVAGLGAVLLADAAPPGADAALLVACGGVALASMLLRGALRSLDPAGGGAAAGWLALAVALLLCVQRTGGLESPLLLLVAALVAVAAAGLDPLWNLLFLSGIALAQTLLAFAAGGAPRPLLLVEVGLLAALGFVANRLAGRVRELEAEVELRSLRDPETGLPKSPIFLAGVVAMLEAGPGEARGVAVLLFAPDPRLDPADAAARLQDAARDDDLVGRMADGRLGVAARCSADLAPGVARRLARAVGGDTRAGWAHDVAADGAADALAAARRLLDEAGERLAAERVGFAA